MKTSFLFLTLFLLFFGKSNLLYSQDAVKIHSHNDYNQTIPFWDAYANGATSIEADIFLKDNNLYVSHNQEDITASKTLEALYLKPLQTALEMKYKKEQQLVLLIDIKTEAEATLNKLVSVLKKYETIIHNQNIKIIVSGNRPNSETYIKYPAFIFFDFQELGKTISKENWEKVAMVSLDFKKYSVWNGLGRLTHDDYARVSSIIAKAKETHKPFRFWGSPDTKSAWKAFLELGVDIINTDKPFSCVQYVESLPKRFITASNSSKVYKPSYKTDQKQLPVKNVILLIGDGNGLSQISSAVLANNGALSVTQLKSIGFIKTQSADDFITDSAAAGTALATGEKTNNRAIGTDSLRKPIPNILEILQKRKFATGVITTDEITGATPAAFYAHTEERSDTDGIAKDLVKSKLNLFVGGGSSSFKNTAVESKFKILASVKDMQTVTSDTIGVFISPNRVPSVLEGRGELLAEATKYSLEFLSKKNKPFFLMVEGAQIDSFGHVNNVAGIVAETIDFDTAITEALMFADKNEGTLVIITADHETSGFGIPQGNLKKHKIEGDFITNDHTATMVPIFSYGPHSQDFQGVFENNEVFHKILSVLELK
ncbi:alkaline phosphatase [Flavobacterium sp. MC2016-06]|uniref:alkaline phosphatase n=1 Tax=Flavobacterium sp. MC2016-06 TaxID=2676308 RepID=UPI0012BA89E5|nr:alkaline phosphatase [Flavobacterium sp. MC2016-06]MBU3858467.1 alkaline phosphatase [Flavobacterium sp. MC2016-06]